MNNNGAPGTVVRADTTSNSGKCLGTLETPSWFCLGKLPGEEEIGIKLSEKGLVANVRERGAGQWQQLEWAAAGEAQEATAGLHEPHLWLKLKQQAQAQAMAELPGADRASMQVCAPSPFGYELQGSEWPVDLLTLWIIYQRPLLQHSTRYSLNLKRAQAPKEASVCGERFPVWNMKLWEPERLRSGPSEARAVSPGRNSTILTPIVNMMTITMILSLGVSHPQSVFGALTPMAIKGQWRHAPSLVVLSVKCVSISGVMENVPHSTRYSLNLKRAQAPKEASVCGERFPVWNMKLWEPERLRSGPSEARAVSPGRNSTILTPIVNMMTITMILSLGVSHPQSVFGALTPMAIKGQWRHAPSLVVLSVKCVSISGVMENVPSWNSHIRSRLMKPFVT
ncbi:hypothetical protein TREES_T100004349 [Tupaia chinensis]|uniref:Uncharacterized protein n=1 Tax=Tupaia chinensis TaxID=246437 RepID=L9KFY0_TUPCH|nr:hypothetical protein TREES_T100004349 [Tupaia chinensis]